MCRIILIICAVFIVSKCSSSSIYLNKDYKDKEFIGKTIMVMPFTEKSIYVQNKDDVQDDFEDDKRDANEVVSDSLYSMIVKKSKIWLENTTVLDVSKDSLKYFSQTDKKLFNSYIFKIGKDSIIQNFFLPKREVILNKNLNPDIIICINEGAFSRGLTSSTPTYSPGMTVSTPGGSFTTPGTFGSSSTETLGADIKFIVYDFSADKIISYGAENMGIPFLFGMSKSTWESVFRNITHIILENVPVKKNVKYKNRK